ncbi:uncharacterized protein LOC108906247 [Anoplophora glabripennis]|uniref:uncharacterized protein LOC108906247 n=1 Tax=Anoplophora glabripennis TaxID=217634 RepID=UPI00087459AC|nr:uncharacterized protein LOC108906247 [Anoplophora glabripennis]
MIYLTPVIATVSISLLFNGFPLIGAEDRAVTTDPSKMQKFVTLDGCKCDDNLQCDCCAGIDLTNTSHRNFCLSLKLIPNEITLRATVTISGNSIYTGQIDPSVAPICPPALAGICLTINHVDIQKRQVCSKVTATIFTLVKFPCIGQTDGKLAVEPNTYP